MRRIPWRDPVGDSLGLGRPVGSGECEPVIGSTVQRIQLRKETNHGSPPLDSFNSRILMRWHRNHALFFHLNEHDLYIYIYTPIYTHTHTSLSFDAIFFPLFKPFFQIKLRFNEPRIANTYLVYPNSEERKERERGKKGFLFSIELFVRRAL